MERVSFSALVASLPEWTATALFFSLGCVTLHLSIVLLEKRRRGACR